ncbi:MAG TPA: ABC transporter substrate-binding protein [Pyrinomonadaceae bacterium]|jgi:ABC-type nitrate/sulfonate/bicarbonate transport system substrate-binding protein
MRVMQRLLKQILTGLAIVLWLCETAGAQTDTVRVVYYPPWNISKLPMYLARDMGIFDRNGLKIAWTDPGSNAKSVAALKKGEADIAVVSSNQAIVSMATGGGPMTFVGNTGYNYSVFLAAASIKSAAELKGKKIGTSPPGETPDQLTRVALRRLGIDPEKDVTLVPFDEERNTDRVNSLLTGQVSGMMVTANTVYDLEKAGQIDRLNKLTDNRQLKIFAGGGADYAVATSFLKNRRDDVKKFMAGICEGIAVARKDKAKALAFVAKSGRDLEPAKIEYLYKLYITEVIPARPHLKIEGIELGIQMAGLMTPSAGALKAQELVDATLVPELEKEGRCNF